MVDNEGKLKIETREIGNFIEFHYQKSPAYRSLHVDGFFGGSTPRGVMTVSFFSERMPIPKHVRRPIINVSESTFTAGEEEVVESLDGIVRHVDATIFMDMVTAKELHEFLGSHIETVEKILEARQRADAEGGNG